MGIDFCADRWVKIKETYGLWWEGKLDRPVIPVILDGKDPGRKEPKTLMLSQSNCNDLTVSVDDLINRMDYELSRQVYLGDAFPYISLDCFGPGIISAFMGAKLDNSSGRVWFHPEKILPINELHFEYDPDNIWLCRIKEICAKAMDYWKGQVLVQMPDLGGVLDALAIFRSTDNLLMDLYDEPEEVKRLTNEIHVLWHRFYNEINDILQPVNPGYSDWTAIYSETPSFVMQSDFSFMISPGMFDEFTKPELLDTCRKLDHSIYHLDGVGQLNHLDSLLEIKELDAVQWVPGDGKPGQDEWPDVYRKIYAAGKSTQLFCGLEGMQKIIGIAGTGRGIQHMPLRGTLNDLDAMQRMLYSFGIE